MKRIANPLPGRFTLCVGLIILLLGAGAYAQEVGETPAGAVLEDSAAEFGEPSADREPSADEEQPSADEEQPSADEEQPSADEEQPSADEEQPSADEEQSSADEEQPSAVEEQPSAQQGDEDLALLPADTAAPLSEQVEDLKQTVLELNRDLLILEEELLFPANTQVALFVSMDVGEFFALDAVKVKINDKLVASHLYTPRQVDALFRGGVQRLFLGNLKSGNHEVTAFFTGKGPEGREYKRGATVTLDKQQEPKALELRIVDSTKKLQPIFDIKEWQL